MTRLWQIANSIHPSIKVKVDFPSNHPNGRMPILDTEQWIENVNIGNSFEPQICHLHYSKPMASKYVILQYSAMPNQNKTSILVANLVRIMRNVSVQCKEEERSEKVQDYLLRLQERHSVYVKAKKKYENIRENANNTTCKFWKQNEWRKQKTQNMKT